MRKVASLSVLALLFWAQAAHATPKVTICHHSAASEKTVSVAQSAVPTHLAHGDCTGSCPCPPPTTTTTTDRRHTLAPTTTTVPVTTTTVERPKSECCVRTGGFGCTDPVCEASVCGADPFCCTNGWDQRCVDAALAGSELPLRRLAS
jgi:hypothetical protein